jgi:FKBP-type peptidyl-prolyl cis-trans isomerase
MASNRSIILALALGSLVVQAPANETPAFKTQQEKASYVIGVDMARNFKRQGVECDVDFVMKGFKDGFAGEKLLIPESDLRQTLVEVQNAVRQKHALNRGKPLAEINKKQGELFLAENKTKEGVVALPDGLQYKILKAGDGRKPADTDTVECNYRGTLLDGTEFDSSKSGQPSVFKVSAVIPGWREALKLMPVGSRWRLFIPPELAYGIQGVGKDIGPNQMLIFEAELLAVK